MCERFRQQSGELDRPIRERLLPTSGGIGQSCCKFAICSATLANCVACPNKFGECWPNMALATCKSDMFTGGRLRRGVPAGGNVEPLPTRKRDPRPAASLPLERVCGVGSLVRLIVNASRYDAYVDCSCVSIVSL